MNKETAENHYAQKILEQEMQIEYLSMVLRKLEKYFESERKEMLIRMFDKIRAYAINCLD